MYSIMKYPSETGELTLCAEGSRIRGLWIEGQKRFMAGVDENDVVYRENSILLRAAEWLERYFAGEKPSGRELEFCPAGSRFEACIREVLLDIPYGETMTYSGLARELCRRCGFSPNCCRAAGTALGKNPVSIIIPCHRILASSGPGGYAAGTDKKLFLLRHEGVKV